MAFQTRSRNNMRAVQSTQARPAFTSGNQNNGMTQHGPRGLSMTQTQIIGNQSQSSQHQPTAVLEQAVATQSPIQEHLQQLKNELSASQLSLNDDSNYEDMDEGKDEEAPLQKWKKRVPGFKITKKVRRKRMNAKLRRLLQPKNAIMVLNELKDSVKFCFHEQASTMQQNYFIVTVEVDGQTFSGQGLSKPAAKQNAAENALKALLLEKMAQSAQGSDADGDVTMKDESTLELPPGTDVPPGEEPPLLDEDGKPVARQQAQAEDDVPWGSLASFALYKLFNEWQSQGTQIPLIKTGCPTTPEGRGPAPMKKLPDNPTERHPVMLLNQLRPALVFNDVCMQGVPPNVVFTMSVTVDGAAYQGMGKNKKEAKKEAAKAALAAIFNIHYDN